MICENCKSRNPVGNKFCRDCGAKLTAPDGSLAAEEVTRLERERVHERVASLLSAAFTLAEQKRYEQAIPIAEEAALLLPDSTSAHALLANLYEHTERDLRAVAEMEKVVALNPDSPADREKLEQLKRGVHVLPRPVTLAADDKEKRRPFPVWAGAVLAGATAACVLGIGVSFLGRDTTPRPAASTNRPAPNPNTQSPASVITSDPATVAQAQAMASRKGVPPPAGVVRDDPFAALGKRPVAPPPAAPTNPALPNSALPLAARPPRLLPPVASAANLAPVRPLRPLRVAPGVGEGGGGGTLPPIIAAPPPPGNTNATFGTTTSPAPPPVETGKPANGGRGDGYIRISVGPPVDNGGGGNPAPAPVTGGTPLSRARRLQSAGRYSEAVSAYQEATSSGAGGEAHQGIAQSYRHLGNDNAARAAYREALRSYEAQVAAGRNVAGAKQGIAACKAALEDLGGQ